jgi:hypothetical protein
VDVYIQIFLTSALAEGGQLHAPAALPPGKKPRYPLDRRLGGPQSRSERREEISWPYWGSNSDPSVVQSVASPYTDYAILDNDKTIPANWV